MKTKMTAIAMAGLCATAMLALGAATAGAQTGEVKDKPPLYSYVATWAIPRPRWSELEKVNAAEKKVLDQAMANGALVGYGMDANLIHQADGPTHDNWTSSMSIAGLLNTLDEMYKAGTPTSPVFSAATKHSDSIYVSRYYNWKSGALKGAYTHTSYYKLKADAPQDAVDLISKNFIVPMMEKLLANGTIAEYEVDQEAVHTDSPSGFWLDYITPTAEGQDKVLAALRETIKDNPLWGPAFSSMVDFEVHRDYLSRTDGVYK